jgi:hypothetical protein
MRDLGPIVGILLGIVGNTSQDRSSGSTIAFQLVGNDPEWSLVACLDRATICEGTARLHVDRAETAADITILIHGTPKILLLAVDSDEKFVQIPGITGASLFTLKASGIVGSEFPAPLMASSENTPR